MRELLKELKLGLLELIFNRRMFWKHDVRTPYRWEGHLPLHTKLIIVWTNRHLNKKIEIPLSKLEHINTTYVKVQQKLLDDIFK
jgi:hypothetical protein